MPKLTKEEQIAFLEEYGVGLRLGCVRPDGGPRVTPISYLYRDGCVYITPREKSKWWEWIREDPRVSLCMDELCDPMRKIIIDGEVQLVHDIGEEDEWRELFRDMMKRYRPAEEADAYVDNTIDQKRGLYKIVLADSKVITWRIPIEGENETGIWHQRYYGEGTDYAEKSKG